MALHWPEPKEYDRALQQRSTTFSDPAIQTGKLVEDSTGPIALNGSGKYVRVYRVDNWVIRCFTQNPPPDLAQRYRSIITYLNTYAGDLSCLVPHQWVEGIRINNQLFPYIKVPFIPQSQPLGDFLAENYQERPAVTMVAGLWLNMINQLEARQIAHGDLDITNILVCGEYPYLALKLIDYDGMYVPSLAQASMSLADLGHEHFQSPQAGLRQFGPEMDRFSALVIYLSLVAIADDPSLWESCGANDTDRLLLQRDDFERLGLSANYQRLFQKQENAPLQKCLRELGDSLKERRIPRALKDILAGPAVEQVLQAPRGSFIPLPVAPPPSSPVTGPIIQPSQAMSPVQTPQQIQAQGIAMPPPPPGTSSTTQGSNILLQKRSPLPTIFATIITAILVFIMIASGSTGGVVSAAFIVCLYIAFLIARARQR